MRIAFRRAAVRARNPHLWAILALTALLGVIYYGDQLNISHWALLQGRFFTSSYVHDLHRALFLLPMIYAALVFRTKGAWVISALTLAVIVPRAALISEYPDPVLRSVIFGLLAGAAAVLLGIERERRERLAAEITRRRLAEKTSTRLAAIVTSSGDAIIGQTPEGIITSWNKGAEDLYGYSAAEVVGRHISILVPPDMTGELEGLLDETRRGEKIERYETVRRRKDGSLVPVSLTISPIRDAEGRITGASIIARDITQRKQAETALRESEARYRALFENTSDGIIVRDLDGNIRMINRAMADLTGYDLSELGGMNIAQLLAPTSLERVREMQARLLAKSGRTSSERYELRLIRKDGTQRIGEAITSLFEGQEGAVYVLATVRDVTEQREARESIRAYANQVLRAQEEERNRIARELHDETLQELASLGLELDLVTKDDGRLPRETLQVLAKLRERTSSIMDGIRRFTRDLRPPMLDELGLVEALQWLVDDLNAQQKALHVSFEIHGTPTRFPPEKELLFFRIAQEALSNVRKHSGATAALVSIVFDPKRATLRVQDNGRGFRVAEGTGGLARLGKLGLIGMQERASLLGGTLTIDSDEGKGTTVTVTADL